MASAGGGKSGDRRSSNSEPRLLVQGRGGMRMVREDGFVSALELDEPEWTADDRFDSCQQCEGKFSFMRRRHHCRRCGQALCGTCCNERAELLRIGYTDPVRVCTPCMKVAAFENDFFKKHLKVLAKGAEVSAREGDGEKKTAKLRLSTDESRLEFLAVGERGAVLEAVPVHTVVGLSTREDGSLQIDTSSRRRLVISGSEGNAGAAARLKDVQRALRHMVKMLNPDRAKTPVPQ